MLLIQREHNLAFGSMEVKIPVGARVHGLHCLSTDETFIKVYDVDEANINDQNVANGFFVPSLQPITLTDYQAQELEGYRMCEGEVVCDSSGTPLKDKYNYFETNAIYEQTIKGETGKGTEFLQVSQTDANGALISISNFIKVGK